MAKKILVCGAGGFIGHHLTRRLRREGDWVRGVDQKRPKYSASEADEFVVGDLRDRNFARDIFDRRYDEIYQLAADMGGAGYLFTGENDAAVLQNSAAINLNIAELAKARNCDRLFFSSSACIYPAHKQSSPDAFPCAEDSAYPAAPDSEYGWEKLFSERLYLAYARNHGMNIRIARYHNIFGPEGSWNNGREKAPAALCRKVAMAADNGKIEIWGDGSQARSFLYIDECIEGTIRLTRSNWTGPVNIGSDRSISINDLALFISKLAEKNLMLKHVEGPVGVRARNSDNRLIEQLLSWKPNADLLHGLETTYLWISHQLARGGNDA